MKRSFYLLKLLVIFLLLVFIAVNAQADISSKAITNISISSTKSLLDYKDGVKITGHLSPTLNGKTVILYQRVIGTGDYTVVGAITTNSSGDFSFRIEPRSSVLLKVGWEGDEGFEASESQPLRVKVKAAISIYRQRKKVAIHKKAVIYGTVSPVHQKKRIWLQYFNGKSWKNLKNTILNNSSRYSFRVTLNNLKTYKFRVKFYDSDHTTSYSKKINIEVYWPNPWGISKKIPRYIVVVKSKYRLYLIRYGNITNTFPVAVGKPSTKTPSSYWKIGEKNPRARGSVQGPLVLRLYRAGRYTRYGIHGTNQEYLLSRWPRGFSKGCIRMYNKDILWLSARVPIGTGVRTM